MCKAFRDEELLLVLSRQSHTIPLAVTLRITSQVNRNIKHSTTHGAYQLALRILLLEMQTAQNALSGHRLIILHEVNINSSFLHIFLVVGFHEIATSITVNSRLNHIKPFNTTNIFLNFNLSHFLLSPLLLLDLFQVTAQCILPSRKRSKACLHQLALIQTTIERTSSLAQTILRRGHWQDFRLPSSLTVDFL